MKPMVPDKNVEVRKVRIPVGERNIAALILSPKRKTKLTSQSLNESMAPGVLWIHGGGYFLGMKEMVFMSRAQELVGKFGAVVVAPGYRLAPWKPYPAALLDCYAALLYLRINAQKLGVRSDQIMVGGESAGGGLCAALCMLARDMGEVNIAYQMPLYPMLDNFDTSTSINNHGKVWNTRLNHLGWKTYLGTNASKLVPAYAAPARQTDYKNLPPAYTFVGTGEPFYAETLTYIKNLQASGIPAKVDVYKSDIHAFDMLKPHLEISKQAGERFNEEFAYAMRHYFALNK